MDPEFKKSYLLKIVQELHRQWPGNRTVNIVCHGHSVPAGYTATPFVDTFNAYPHLLHRALKERFPFAVINVIVTAIGGEYSEQGASRFQADVLCHRPNIVTIDYGLNDRGIGLTKAAAAWRKMIELAVSSGVKVILLTPTVDVRGYAGQAEAEWDSLEDHSDQIRRLAAEYGVGLADSYECFSRFIVAGGELGGLLSWVNHPNRKGHELVAEELMSWFPHALPESR